MSVNSRLVNPLTTQLFEAILLLENVDECYEFFEDLCTVNELHDMSQRLQVAKMLQEKRMLQGPAQPLFPESKDVLPLAPMDMLQYCRG